ncbi:unnamed protein product, partial [Aureobasidium pullulans]
MNYHRMTRPTAWLPGYQESRLLDLRYQCSLSAKKCYILGRLHEWLPAMITSSCCQLLALLDNYRSALLVWWTGLLSALPTASDGLIKDLQSFIRGKGGHRTTSLLSKASSMDQQSGNDLRQRDGLRPEREDAHLDPVLAILRDRCCLECCLPKAANRQSTRHHRPFRSTSDVLVCLFINSDMTVIEDPGYLAKCLVMPLITLFHNAKSSRSANFHDQSTIMTASRDGYTIATSKPSASETATSMPYTSSKFHLIERRNEVSKHPRYVSGAEINQRITRSRGRKLRDEDVAIPSPPARNLTIKMFRPQDEALQPLDK